MEDSKTNQNLFISGCSDVDKSFYDINDYENINKLNNSSNSNDCVLKEIKNPSYDDITKDFDENEEPPRIPRRRKGCTDLNNYI